MIFFSFLFFTFSSFAAEISADILQNAVCPVDEDKIEELFPTPDDPDHPVKPAADSFAEREERLGKCSTISMIGERKFILQYPDAKVLLQILTAGPDEPKALRFGRPIFAKDSYEAAWADLRWAAPRSSVLVQKNDHDVFAKKEDDNLGVDLSFGLFLLDAVRALKISRRELLNYEGIERLPWSGLMGQWPERMAITLDTALALLFVHRDRTAFDLLAERIGLEQLSAARDEPFLTQGEFARYVRMKPKSRKYLGPVGSPGFKIALRNTRMPDDPLPPQGETSLSWQASTRELCQLLKRHRNEPVLQFSGTLANFPQGKGSAVEGWGPSIAQLTYGYFAPSTNDWICVSITSNFKGAVREDRVLEAMERMLNLVSK